MGMIPFLREVIGAIVWAAANMVYVDMRRKGTRGFGRFAAFFAGLPTTLVALFVVREPGVPPLEPPPDDEERLLREIRVDRELRDRAVPPGGPTAGEGTGDTLRG